MKILNRLTWIVCAALLAFVVWLLQPVKIMDVHKQDGITTVLVEHLPVWRWWQKAWFTTHQAELEKRYGIPVKEQDGSWSIFFMGWQGGYRKDSLTDEDSDLLCFDDMNTDVNCIRKEPLLWVSYTPQNKLHFW
ncbi:DUF943 family protein [Enterobacteriaceae bacterium]